MSNRPFESYSDFYLKEIQEIIVSKICTNVDNDVAKLYQQEFFANIHEMIDDELEAKKAETIQGWRTPKWNGNAFQHCFTGEKSLCGKYKTSDCEKIYGLSITFDKEPNSLMVCKKCLEKWRKL